MKRARTMVLLPTSFMVVCLVLGWVIYQQFAAVPNSEAFARLTTGTEIDLPDLPPDPQFSIGPIENFDNVLERPIFSPNRRPPTEESATAPTVSQKFDFTLKGVLIDAEVRMALLRRDRDGQIFRLEAGDEADGWTLVEVEPNFVVFERDGKEVLLEMAFDVQRPAGRRQAQGNNKR